MAKVELNEALGSLRGKIDGWVYRQQYGRTIVSPYEAPKKTGKSAAQKQTRVRFGAAQAYAAMVMSDPLQRRVYQKLGAERKRPPNALLVSNYLTPPVIEQIDATGYTGRSGQLIRVLALDPIAVAAVTVSIRAKSGALVESGGAVNDHGVWSYLATANAPAGTLLQIEVAARNHARAEAKQVIDARTAS